MAYQNSWTLDTIHLDMTKRRYLLLKDAYGKAKDCTSVDFACG